jgi:putative ABC transport system permease protein
MKRNHFRWILLKRSLQQKKGKALLIILATTMGASVVTALLSLEIDLRYRMNRELRDYGPNVVLVADPASGSSYLDNSLVQSLRKHRFKNEILSYAPELLIPARLNGVQTTMVGTSLSSLRKLYPNWKFESSASSEPGAFVGVRITKKLNLKPNDTAELKVGEKETPLHISGIVESGEAEDDRVFVELATAQRWSGNEGKFQVLALSVVGEIPGVESDFKSFLKSFPGVELRIVRKIAVGETMILDRISKLISLVILIILVTLFFCINTTVSAIMLSRQSEIALFRVLGARRRQIFFELTFEQVVLGLIGGCLGFLLGVVMAQVLGQVLFQTFVIPHGSIFGVAILSSLFMMVVSTILPIRRAVNRDAALVLKEA